MPERDMTEAGRAWMRGELPAAEYFAMARRDVAPGRRLRAGLVWVLRYLAMPHAGREGRQEKRRP